MKILLIISQFKPAQTPNTLRWIPLLHHFASKGHEVNVLTTKRKGVPNDTTSDNLRTYRAGYNTLMDLIYDKLSIQSRRNETGQNSYSGKPGPLRMLVEKLTDKYWRSRYWPDGSQLFLNPGIQKGNEIIAQQNISHVISVGLPFSSHLIAQKLKEKNPQLKWHMDIQDPFCYSKEFWVNNFDRYEQKNIEAEKQAFNNADSISITNENAQKKYADLFPMQSPKVKVIPPLFVPTTTNNNTDLKLDRNKIHLGYFGSFYQGVRSPLPFIHFLDAIDKHSPELKHKIQFHLFGQQNKFSYPILNSRPNLKSYFAIHGFVNRSESMQCMSKMDLLVNFGNTTNYHLPSKVVDLLYMNKGIVNFTATEEDSTQAFLSHYDDILNLNTTSISSEMVFTFLDFVFRERIDRNPDLKKVNDYSVSILGQKYLDCLES